MVTGLKKNTDYYLSYNKQTISGTENTISVFAGTTQDTPIKIFSGNGTFNTGNNTIINIWFYVGSGFNNPGEANFTNIQLEESTTPTNYVAHKSQTFTFPLGNEKLMLGDYLADDGIHHKMREDDLSTLTWASLGSNLYRSTAIDNIKIPVTSSTVPNILAEKYKARMQAGNFLNGEIAIMGGGNNAGDLLVCDETGTPSGLIQYELEEEVIVPYTSAQQEVYNQIKQALSYEEQTNIRGSSNVSNPIFSVEGYQSTKLVLEEMATAIVALGGV